MDAHQAAERNRPIYALVDKRRENPVLFGLLLVLNVAIPKAGFKVGDVPILSATSTRLFWGSFTFPKASPAS
ncbi:hypothetical protein PQR75_37785 [Paraburkholderia fungorum]|uniref:hypothetical protein n=1 Tax=Paraburkholderia fungorum TaxID=134537 RepID=UPI0038BD2460